MVEDTPDDLVHELFTQSFWEGHPLGRPILGTQETRRGVRPRTRCASTSADAYVAPNLIVAAVGNLEHARVRELVEQAFGGAAARSATPVADAPPAVVPQIVVRDKELEQSHVCLGVERLPAEPRRPVRRATC